MTTKAETGVAGFVHEAVVYGSDDELLDIIVTYLGDALSVGQPVLLALVDHEAAVVREAIGEPPGVTFLAPLHHEQPPSAIKRLTGLRELTTDGIEQIRLVNHVPHPGLGTPWDGWRRYEAAVNGLFGDLPARELCLYDRRITPGDVLADVARTHPRIRAADGTPLPNPSFQDPGAFLRSLPPPPPDPLERQRPDVELVDPSAAAGRHAVEEAASRTRVPVEEIGRLVLAVSEAATNAVVHGRPPVTMRVWTAPERIVVTVSDHGPGIQDPYAGLVPSPSVDGLGGFGLWIMHQLVTANFFRQRDGFTVRLLAGEVVV
jgi:anti-sigma regulatory factor (Ser/Thr protein kinase)